MHLQEAKMRSDLIKILHNLVLDNPVPAKVLAKEIGKPYSTLLREINPYDTGAKLGVETLLQIMKHTRNVTPLEYMANQLGYTLVASKGELAQAGDSPGERLAPQQTM